MGGGEKKKNLHGSCYEKMLINLSDQFGFLCVLCSALAAQIAEALYKEPSLALATLCDLAGLN